MLGDAEERVSAAELTYLFIALVASAALAAFLIGVRAGKSVARLVLIAALAVFVVSFSAYAWGTNFGRDHQEFAWVRDVAQWLALGAWFALYAAAGASGPAFLANRFAAIALSVTAILGALTAGTYLMFTLACAFAGECL